MDDGPEPAGEGAGAVPTGGRDRARRERGAAAKRGNGGPAGETAKGTPPASPERYRSERRANGATGSPAAKDGPAPTRNPRRSGTERRPADERGTPARAASTPAAKDGPAATRSPRRSGTEQRADDRRATTARAADGARRGAPNGRTRPPAGSEAARGEGTARRRPGDPPPARRPSHPEGAPAGPRRGALATAAAVANRVQVVDKRLPGRRVLTARLGEKAPRVDRAVFGQPSGSRASAGRVLAVGLLCFAIWTLFDANQLYHNALSSPFGTRRSVALSVLRPLAALSNVLHFSGPVNAADSALGRNGPATNPVLPPPPGRSVASRAPNDAGAAGLAPHPHTRVGEGVSTVTPVTAWPPPLTQPTVAHPLVMLDIGDSIGEDLGFGLGDVFSHDPYVRVVQKAQIDTGLARPDYYNWPAALAAEVKTYHPGVVVIMMGANDDQALSMPNGQAVAYGTTTWNTVYLQRINLLMEEALASGSHVVWVGLPPLNSPAVNSAFASHVNRLAEEAAGSHSGVTYVSSWSTLSGSHGTFVQYKKVNGSVQQIRYSDGVHLAPTGWDLLASSLLAPMSHALRINLHATPLLTVG